MHIQYKTNYERQNIKTMEKKNGTQKEMRESLFISTHGKYRGNGSRCLSNLMRIMEKVPVRFFG